MFAGLNRIVVIYLILFFTEMHVGKDGKQMKIYSVNSHASEQK